MTETTPSRSRPLETKKQRRESNAGWPTNVEIDVSQASIKATPEGKIHNRPDLNYFFHGTLILTIVQYTEICLVDHQYVYYHQQQHQALLPGGKAPQWPQAIVSRWWRCEGPFSSHDH